MTVQILATGSGGNCVLVDGKILIDAGISVKLFQSYGIVPEQLSALIITHRHGDHMKTPLVRYLLNAGVKAYLPSEVIGELTKEGKIDLTPLLAGKQIERILPEPEY